MYQIDLKGFKVRRLALLSLVVFASFAFSAGPNNVASVDRTIWPIPINSVETFNFASMMEISIFAAEFQKISFDTDFIMSFTGRNKIDLASVLMWKEKTEIETITNFKNACHGSLKEDLQCEQVASIEDNVDTGNKLPSTAPEQLADWRLASAEFHRRYLYEQIRLAALFPRVTSEILTLTDNEITGETFSDLTFELSFDDGPSQSNTTRKMVQLLDQYKTSATFYLLGEQVANLSLENTKTLYSKNQCIGSHGYTHKAHPKLNNWKQSLTKTIAQIETHFAPQKAIPFRPPYGQRTLEMNHYLDSIEAGPIVLWNIDSQDWNRKLSAKQITDRTITLMLLKRKGILLFHDIYDRNLDVIEQLLLFMQSTGQVFRPC